MNLQPLNLDYFTKLLENEPNILMMAQAMTVLIDGIQARDERIVELVVELAGANDAVDFLQDEDRSIEEINEEMRLADAAERQADVDAFDAGMLD